MIGPQNRTLIRGLVTTIRHRLWPAQAPPIARETRSHKTRATKLRAPPDSAAARWYTAGCRTGPIPTSIPHMRCVRVNRVTGLPQCRDIGTPAGRQKRPQARSAALGGAFFGGGVHQERPARPSQPRFWAIFGAEWGSSGPAHRSAARRALVTSLPPPAAARWVLQGGRSPAGATARIASPRCAPPVRSKRVGHRAASPMSARTSRRSSAISVPSMLSLRCRRTNERLAGGRRAVS